MNTYHDNQWIEYPIKELIGKKQFYLLYIFFASIKHHSSSAWSQLAGFMVSTMTWSKTMLYFLLSTPCCHGDHDYHAGVNWQTFVLIYIIPNGFWIVLPFLCMVSLGKRLVQPSQGKQTGKND